MTEKKAAKVKRRLFRLLHPKTWQALCSTLSDYILDADLWKASFIGFALPMAVVWVSKLALLQPPALLLPALISPWSIGCLVRPLPNLLLAATTGKNWIVKRAETLPSAVNAFQERYEQGRAIRYYDFDVYLPPTKAKKAILFLPGAMVEHAAYSEVASRISDGDVLMVVISLEPTRLIPPSVNDIHLLTQKIERMLPDYLDNDTETAEQRLEWIVAGHSMGAFYVATMANDLYHRFGVSKVVLWGMGHLMHPKIQEPIHVLILQGSEDPGMQRGDRSSFLSHLPKDAKEKIIPGGNHQQFGSYVGRISKSQDDRDIATISHKEQHDQVANLTLEFCFRNNITI